MIETWPTLHYIQGFEPFTAQFYSIEGKQILRRHFLAKHLHFLVVILKACFDFVQVTVAGYTAGKRAKHVPNAKYIAGASILVGTFITMVVLVSLKVFPFTPQYIIPVAGMMVGNAMTVTGVTLKRLREDLRQQQGLVGSLLIVSFMIV
jgi:putative ABC transport system permease protein